MKSERFVQIDDEKALDTRNDVVMRLEDCVFMLNVAETIITGSLISMFLEKLENE